MILQILYVKNLFAIVIKNLSSKKLLKEPVKHILNYNTRKILFESYLQKLKRGIL